MKDRVELCFALNDWEGEGNTKVFESTVNRDIWHTHKNPGSPSSFHNHDRASFSGLRSPKRENDRMEHASLAYLVGIVKDQG